MPTMNSFLLQLGVTLRLHYRNRMALVYSYLFPTIFLLAFWILYRHEPVPLARHIGELLTVTALGGACFGLPTAMVSERERGVWRRYRLAPVPIASVVTSTVIARYVLLIGAALLQLALAMGIGMPPPAHPFGLWLAFTFVAFAFLGLGLVIAMLADSVPAVQALGQCVFLPMLIIGGVAVRLESLPGWAQHVSAFFPGRYAVEAIQASVTGDGLRPAVFSIVALAVIGVAGGIAGAKMFRWEARQRFAAYGEKGWVGVALAAWLAVGLLAEAGGYIAIVRPAASGPPAARADVVPRPGPSDTPRPPARAATEPAGPTPRSTESEVSRAMPDSSSPPERRSPVTSSTTMAAESASRVTADAAPTEPQRWQDVVVSDIEDDLYDDLPPDEGIVAPVAASDEPPYPDSMNQLECMRAVLPAWGPGRVSDPVQRVRNYLYIAAVPDMFRMETLERWVPLVVFDRLKQDIPEDDLTRILYWIASHPSDDDSAADQLHAVCLDIAGPSDIRTLRERVAFYALKLLGRLTGAIAPG